MCYNCNFSLRESKREILNKLDTEYQKRVLNQLELLSDTPHSDFDSNFGDSFTSYSLSGT